MTLRLQNFGYIPGKKIRFRVSSRDGTALREIADRFIGAAYLHDGATTVPSAELDELRAALAIVDFGAVQEVFGGGGCGSNFRGLELSTSVGRCARSSTNSFPVALQPLVAILTRIASRVGGLDAAGA